MNKRITTALPMNLKFPLTLLGFMMFAMLMMFVPSAQAFQKESYTLQVGGQSRGAVVYKPSTTSTSTMSTSMPLMIVSHDSGATPEAQAEADGLYLMVDTAKFVVAYLRALETNGVASWDLTGSQDVNFVLQAIDGLVAEYQLDGSRVYWSGFSQGAQLIYHAMPDVQDKVAAFAPSGAVLSEAQPWTNCTQPVSLIHCHAYTDNVYDYTQYKVREYVENFAKMNEYTTYIKFENYQTGGTISGDKELWSSDVNGHTIVLYSFQNGSHSTQQENASEIWNFCKSFKILTPIENYQKLYSEAEGLLSEWKYTTEMTQKTEYSSLRSLLTQYPSANMTTEAVVNQAVSALTAGISAFRNATQGVTMKGDSGQTDLPDGFDPKFHIYLCFGQSNMEGNAQIEAQDRDGIDPRFKMMAAVNMSTSGRQKGEWYTAVPPLCRQSTKLCPADYFGREMVANLPEAYSVGVINVSVAGCSINCFDPDNCASYISSAADWLRNICSEYGNNPYKHLIDLAKKAQEKGVIKGILLHQGESDSGQQSWIGKVEKIYKKMLVDLGLNQDEVPLIIGEMPYSGSCSGHNNIIRQAAGQIGNAHIASAQGCTVQSDNLHFTSEGYRILGKNYAQTMLGLLDLSADGSTMSVSVSLSDKKVEAGTTITITANLPDGTVIGGEDNIIEFAVNGKTIGTNFTTNTRTYETTEAGTYKVSVKVLSATSTGYEEVGSASTDLTVYEAVTPFVTPIPTIPGVVEAENFDRGSSEISYYDSDTKDEGDANYRDDNTGVDVVTGGSGYAIGYTAKGEWLNYTVNVLQKGTYTVKATVASGSSTSAFSVSLADETAKFNVPQTANNSWDTYEEMTQKMTINKTGKQTLKITIDASYCNIDKIEFVCDECDNPNGVELVETGFEAGNYNVFTTLGIYIGRVYVDSFAEMNEKVFDLTKHSGVYLIRNEKGAQLRLIRQE